MKLAERLELAPHLLRAAIEPSTFDTERRTVEVVWTVGAPVARRSARDGEPYEETLSLEPKHVRLDRLNAGASVLNNHRAWGGLEGILGVVERAWIEKGEGRALIRFSRRDELAGIVRDIESGIVRHVSVGYRVHRYEDRTREGDRHRRLHAVDWEPLELSFVTVPADPRAAVRSEPVDLYPCDVFREDDMTETKFGAGVAGESREAPAPAPQDTTTRAAETPQPKGKSEDEVRAEATRAATEAERARQREIREHCRAFDLGEDVTERLVDSGKRLAELTAEVRDAYVAKRAKNDAGEIRTHVEVGTEDFTKRKTAAELALVRKLNPSAKVDADLGEFNGRSAMDIVRLLEHGRGGDGLRMGREDVLRRAFGAHATSDFPLLLESAGRRTLRDAFETAPATWRPWTREGTLTDFRVTDRIKLGDTPALTKIPQNADVKYGTLGESREQVQLGSYGIAVSVGREALVNDDLGAFGRILQGHGQAVSDLVASLAYAQLTGGTLLDGNSIWHSSRNNTITGASSALAVQGLGLLEAKMMLQANDRGAPLNLTPEFLIVPVAHKVTAEQLVAEIQPSQASQANPFRGRLTVIAEARLDADSTAKWYLAANPARIDTIEVNWLEGNVGPQFATEEHFESRGVKYAVFADVAAKAIEYRGLGRSDNS